MELEIVMFNALMAGALCCASTWAVLSKKVRDGFVMRWGLILSALGHGMTAVTLADGLSCNAIGTLDAARFLSHVGLLTIAAGLYWRIKRIKRRGEEPSMSHFYHG